MPRSKQYYLRKTHRYLGVLLGIQFLFWTLGGLYFSWSNIDEIHGDFQHKHVPRLKGDIHLASPDSVWNQLLQKPDSINSVQLINILQRPYYSITYYAGNKLHKILADAQTAGIRSAINKAEAIEIATANFNGKPNLKSIEYLTGTNGHHEYRQKPLPAWAVSFDHPTKTTVYVSSEFGRVESFRNNKWRVFDFLWMMHTMDYRERDNINNWLLRAFSVFGLLTIFSGFALYWVSSKRIRWIKRRAKLITPNS